MSGAACDYEASLIGPRINPHNWVSRIDRDTRNRSKGLLWLCRYCSVLGTLEELDKLPCSFEYPPCDYCGDTPTCTRDCKGMAAVLSMPGVVVIGGLADG